jgi:hypothetical protein
VPRRNLWIVSMLLWLAAVDSSYAQSDAQGEQPVQPQIAQWVQQLGDDSYEVREAAKQELIQAGRQAIGAMAAATQSDNAEVAWRAGNALEQIGIAGDQQTLAEVCDTLDRLSQSGRPALAKSRAAMQQRWSQFRHDRAAAEIRRLGGELSEPPSTDVSAWSIGGGPYFAPYVVYAYPPFDASSDPYATGPGPFGDSDPFPAAPTLAGDEPVPLPDRPTLALPPISTTEPTMPLPSASKTEAEIKEGSWLPTPPAAADLAESRLPRDTDELKPADDEPAAFFGRLSLIVGGAPLEVGDAGRKPVVEEFEAIVSDDASRAILVSLEEFRRLTSATHDDFDVGRTLRLGKSWIGSDADLRALGELTQVTSLEIRDREVSATAIEHISRMSELRQLTLHKSRFDRSAVERLKKAKPDLHVLAIGDAVLGVSGDTNSDVFHVTTVLPKSGSAKAGIVPGDIIRTINGEPVTSFESLTWVLADKQVGQSVTVEFLRGDKTITVDVTLSARESR